jgi:cytochrome c biogenesis protein CcdA
VVVVGDRLLIGGPQIERDLRSLIAEGPTSTISIDIEAIPLCEDASCRADDPIWLLYFHQPGCRACSRVEADLRHLRMRSPRVIVESMSSYERLPLGRWAAARVGREFGTPSVFVGERALIGEAEIDPARLEQLVDRYRSGAAPFWHDAPEEALGEDVSSRFRALGPAAIVIAGLLDGINPCAFATLIFLVSYLAATGRRGRQILAVGAAFTLGVFIAYLGVGLGLHRTVDALSAWLTELGRWLLIATGLACALLAAFSVADWAKARRGKIDEMSLVLPEFLKKRIRAVIRKSARTEAYVIAAFAAGLVVSMLELACTGQVYLPTIVFMTSRAQPRFEDRRARFGRGRGQPGRARGSSAEGSDLRHRRRAGRIDSSLSSHDRREAAREGGRARSPARRSGSPGESALDRTPDAPDPDDRAEASARGGRCRGLAARCGDPSDVVGARELRHGVGRRRCARRKSCVAGRASRGRRHRRCE